jgi:hypothetical protein
VISITTHIDWRLFLNYNKKMRIFNTTLTPILMGSINAKRSIPANTPEDLKTAVDLILDAMLSSQNKIILSL